MKFLDISTQVSEYHVRKRTLRIKKHRRVAVSLQSYVRLPMRRRLSRRRRRVVEHKSNELCWYCGGFVLPDPRGPLGKTYDHKTPKAHGCDPHDHHNLVLAHRCCNNEKGDMTLDEYREYKGVDRFYGEGGPSYEPVSEDLVFSDEDYEPEETRILVEPKVYPKRKKKDQYRYWVVLEWSNGERVDLLRFHYEIHAERVRDSILALEDLRKIQPRSRLVRRLIRKFSSPQYYQASIP